jgi:hypothetical protein
MIIERKPGRENTACQALNQYRTPQFFPNRNLHGGSHSVYGQGFPGSRQGSLRWQSHEISRSIPSDRRYAIIRPIYYRVPIAYYGNGRILRVGFLPRKAYAAIEYRMATRENKAIHIKDITVTA